MRLPQRLTSVTPRGLTSPDWLVFSFLHGAELHMLPNVTLYLTEPLVTKAALHVLHSFILSFNGEGLIQQVLQREAGLLIPPKRLPCYNKLQHCVVVGGVREVSEEKSTSGDSKVLHRPSEPFPASQGFGGGRSWRTGTLGSVCT